MVSAFIFMAGAEGLEPSARGFGANRGRENPVSSFAECPALVASLALTVFSDILLLNCYLLIFQNYFDAFRLVRESFHFLGYIAFSL